MIIIKWVERIKFKKYGKVYDIQRSWKNHLIFFCMVQINMDIIFKLKKGCGSQNQYMWGI